jgi:two-component system, NarL family, response regulator DevR
METKLKAPARVFVVEDSPLIRKRIIDDLVSLGRFEIVGVAERQPEAIASISALCPDIVTTDIQLKEGSGIEVVRQVRANPNCPPPRIFVLTNYTYPEYRRKCMSSGADQFFDKTSEYGRFLLAMEQAVQTVPACF